MGRRGYLSHLKESPEDLATKVAAWRGTEKRLMIWANQYAESHKVGEGETDYQKAILADAKEENFPNGIVRKIGSLVRRIGAAEEEKRTPLQAKMADEKRKYATSIGLGRALH